MPARGEFDIVRYFASAINLKATGQTLVIPALAGRKFVPIQAILHLTNVNAYAVTAAVVRLGNNGTFDNVCPLFTVALANVTDNTPTVPLVGTVKAIDIGATGISLDVQTAGAATTLTGTIHLMGILV